MMNKTLFLHGCFSKVCILQLLIWLPTGLMYLRDLDLDPESQVALHWLQELHVVRSHGAEPEDLALPIEEYEEPEE